MPEFEKLFKKLDSAIKDWFNREKPFELVDVPSGPYGKFKNSTSCPVCGTPMKYDYDMLDGYILLEEYNSCPNRCYSYEFSTGSTRTNVGALEVHGHYTDSEEEREYKSRIVNLAIIHYREEWRKKHGNQDSHRPEEAPGVSKSD